MTLSFLPAPTYSDLETAVSSLLSVLLSNCYKPISKRPLQHLRSPIPRLPRYPDTPRGPTYLSAGNNHLNLALRRRNQDAELLADAVEQAEPVVLGQGAEEVADRLAAGAHLLRELVDDGALVLGGERRRGEHGLELGVLSEEGLEGGEGLGRGVEGRGLDGRRVLPRLLAFGFAGCRFRTGGGWARSWPREPRRGARGLRRG